MRNLFIFIAVISFLSACVNKDRTTSNAFKDVDGLLYYEKPETGSVVYAVFLPFSEKKSNFNLQDLDSSDFKSGIKFGTANSIVKDRLYSEKHQKLILKGGIDRPVYLISKAKIYFHIEKPTFQEDNVIEKHVRVDTLVYMSKYMKFKYRFSWITLDSIKAN